MIFAGFAFDRFQGFIVWDRVTTGSLKIVNTIPTQEERRNKLEYVHQLKTLMLDQSNM
jgi:hypothetical protein